MKDAGAVYAPYSEAGRLAVNGYPTFYSMSVVHKDDMPELLKWIKHWEDVLEIPEAERIR